MFLRKKDLALFDFKYPGSFSGSRSKVVIVFLEKHKGFVAFSQFLQSIAPNRPGRNLGAIGQRVVMDERHARKRFRLDLCALLEQAGIIGHADLRSRIAAEPSSRAASHLARCRFVDADFRDEDRLHRWP